MKLDTPVLSLILSSTKFDWNLLHFFSGPLLGPENLTKQVLCIMADAKPNYEENVKKYVTNVDAGAVAGIVKYLGIALRSKDSSLVASSDPVELARVRDNFLKKKLGLAESDAELDAALKAVMTTMKAEREKSRVTVCYLLAEKFGKLDRFKPKP